jgi:hypothetical protein
MNYALYAVAQVCGIAVIFSQILFSHLTFIPVFFAQASTDQILTNVQQVETWGIVTFLVAAIIYLLRDRKTLISKLDEMTAKMGGLTDAMHANTEAYKIAAEKLTASSDRQIEALSELKANQINLYSRILERKEN